MVSRTVRLIMRFIAQKSSLSLFPLPSPPPMMPYETRPTDSTLHHLFPLSPFSFFFSFSFHSSSHSPIGERDDPAKSVANMSETRHGRLPSELGATPRRWHAATAPSGHGVLTGSSTIGSVQTRPGRRLYNLVREGRRRASRGKGGGVF